MPSDLLSREDFMKLSMRELHDLTGVARPDNSTEEENSRFREEAWRSYQIDIGNAEEWGNARQESEVATDA